MNKDINIVDVNGTPFTVKDLEVKQSDDNAQVAMLKQEFAEHPSRGLTPAKLACITGEAEHGNIMMQCDLAEDMEEKDGHLFAELSKRKSTLLTVPWSVKPPRNATDAEKQDALLINEILIDSNLVEDTIFDMADGILKGFSNLEMGWEYRDGLHIVETIEHKPQRWFQVNPNNQNELRLRDQSFEGLALKPMGWIQHQHKAKSGYIARANLIRVLAWPYLFKNYSVRDLAEFLEIYGIPARIGKYSTGATPAEKSSLLQAIMSIGHNAGGIIPKGMDIEFEKAAQGQADPFELMINWCEKTVSKIVLGSTLTSQADGKSSTNALGNVHNESRIELRNSDLRQISNTLTRDLIKPLYMLNGKSYNNERRLPRFEFDIQEPEDLALYAESIPKLVSSGLQIPVSWVRNKLQMPAPEKDEEVLSNAVKAPESNNTEGKKPASLATSMQQAITALKAIEPTKDPIDKQTDQLAAALSPQLKSLVETIENLVNNASSLEVLQAELLGLELPREDMAKVMQLALSSAEFLGRYEVEQGN